MKYLSLLLFLALFLSCTAKQKDKNIDGYWMQEGYGVYLEVSDSNYKMYDVTEISCQPSVSGSISSWTDSLSTLLDLYSVIDVNSESMLLKYGITSYKFNKLETPLTLCESPIFESTDPKLNFDIFWYTFKENYAYSKVRQVDWDTIYEKHINLIHKETSQVELFGYIAEILDAIKDEHISLRVPDSISTAYLAIRTPPTQEENSPQETESEASPTQEEVEYSNPRAEAMSKIVDLYPNTEFQSYHKDLVLWGKLTESIGYVQINSMNGFSEQIDVSENLSHDQYWEKHWNAVFSSIENGKTLGQYLRDEVNGAKMINETILSEFLTTSGLIIDLRFNPGGTDKVALELLSSFTKGGEKAFTKKVWTKGESNFESAVYIPKSSNTYTGKIIVLTSSQTGSSAETFVLASRELPNFTQVGSRTMGIFSDVLQKSLPNGWNYGLSNEIYETDNQENFEYIGITPDHMIDYSRNWYNFHVAIQELKEIDPAINLSLSILEAK